jgi:type II secretory pathway component PulF
MFGIAAHERAALQFDDLASALDAGLPLSAFGGEPTLGDRVLHGILQRRGVRLSATEDSVMMHSWRAGRASQQLRHRAAARRQQAELRRGLWQSVRYPLLLAGMGLLICITTMTFVGPWPLVSLLLLYGSLGGAVFAVVRASRSGALWLRRLPWLHALMQSLAELPYLETLRALYGAGVDLRQAHAAATATVPPGELSQRLQIVNGMVQIGQPLREGLQQALALHPETRSLLTTGEQAGQLEDALERAWQRRSTVTQRDLTQLSRGLGYAAYALALGITMLLIINFYTGYFARIGRM